jgi:hypothetical protein
LDPDTGVNDEPAVVKNVADRNFFLVSVVFTFMVISFYKVKTTPNFQRMLAKTNRYATSPVFPVYQSLNVGYISTLAILACIVYNSNQTAEDTGSGTSQPCTEEIIIQDQKRDLQVFLNPDQDYFRISLTQINLIRRHTNGHLFYQNNRK